MLKWTIRILMILLLVAAGLFVRTQILGGAFRSVDESFAGTCTSFAVADETGAPQLVGVEDIVIDHERGVAYLSAIDRRAGDSERGAIYLLPLHATTPPQLLVDITSGAPENFQPHGIDLHIDETGQRRLFVVDHGAEPSGGEPRILIYTVTETGLLAQEGEPITSKEFVSVNDVAAAGPRDFYATNDVRAKRGSNSQLIAGLLALRKGEVVFYNGEAQKASVVADGMAYANGVLIDHERSLLYVAELLLGRAHSYQILDDGALKKLSTVDTGAGGDNFALDANGDLYLAQHIDMFDFLKHEQDRTRRSPSNVVRFKSHISGDALQSKRETVLAIRGLPAFGAEDGLNGLSIAAVSDNVMLLGTVFEPRIWRCELAD